MTNTNDDAPRRRTRDEMDLENTLWSAFRHAYHADHSNAAMHCATVRYSPLTFRLAELLTAMGRGSMEIGAVMFDAGQYAEDKGR